MTRKEKSAWRALLVWGRAIRTASEANSAREVAEGRRKDSPALSEAGQEKARDVEQEADEALDEAKNLLWAATDKLPLTLAYCENPIWRLLLLVNAGYTVGQHYDNDSLYDWLSYKEDELYEAIEPLLDTKGYPVLPSEGGKDADSD